MLPLDSDGKHGTMGRIVHAGIACTEAAPDDAERRKECATAHPWSMANSRCGWYVAPPTPVPGCSWWKPWSPMPGLGQDAGHPHAGTARRKATHAAGVRHPALAAGFALQRELDIGAGISIIEAAAVW